MVYVAANDGTLRGFRTSDGEEVLGFIPSVAMPRLKGLLSPAYQHRYLNDGSPVTTDANFGGGWNTVLVGTAGTGGPSVYALNVTNPTTFGPSDVLWELTSAQDSDLGTRIGTVSVALAEGNRWLAVFGNGYNSASFDARVFVVDLATGNIVREFDVGDGDALNPNGVGNVIVVDSDGNGYSDSIYAGTYRGEIWKMNIKGANDAAWGLAVNASGVAQPLFVAERGGVRQPITGGIDVVRGPTVQDASGNNIVTSMVLFGTGRYFVVGDNIPQANPPIQSFYGVLDNTVTLNLTRSDLVEQRITSEVVDGATSRVRRDITQNGVDFETESGWFLDLFVQSGPSPTGNGERFIGSPAAIGGSIFFITFRPTGDECLPGGRNLFYGLDALTGSPVLLGATVGGSDPCGSSTGCGAIESGQGPPSQRPAFVVPPLGCIPGVDPGCANVTDCDPNDPTCTTPPCDPRDPSCVPPCDPATDPDCRVACPPGDPTCIPPPATRGQCLLVEFSASAGGAGGPNIRVIRPCGRQVWRQMQ
jgi:type IV pilus assembly protein PilY1